MEHTVTEPTPSPATDPGLPTPESASRLSVEIERLVRNEVEIQLAKEQKLLKESVGLAAKIVGAAITIFLAIFTIFGLTTWRDIKRETAQIVKKQAEELIQKADSDTSVKDTLNDLLNRAVVSSNLASRARGSNRDIVLAPNDWDRLRGWIRREDLPLQDFSDTLAVLNLQSDERKKTDANRLIAEMLNPPEKSPYRWITKQPEKTESILSNFKHKDLGSSAVELVASAALTDSIRSQAAIYVREVKFLDGVERLLVTYRTLPWGKAKQNALTTCLALRPDQSEVVGEVKRLITEEPRREKVDTIVDVIAMMPRSKSKIDSSVNQDEFKNLSKDLLLYAAKNGLYFNLRDPDPFFLARMRVGDDETLLNKQVPLLPHITLMVSTSKSSASGAGSFSITEFRELEAYWQLLGDLANAGDMERLRSTLLRANLRGNPASPQQIQLQLMMSADAGALVTVVEKGGTPKELDLKTLLNAHVASTDVISDPQARISWIDGSGQVVTAQLAALKGKNYKFSLQRVDAVK